MSDEELVKRLRDPAFGTETSERLLMVAAADRIDALTEQLEAARADAKEAEAYAEELAGDQVDLCSQLIAAEDKLAKAVEALRYYAGRTTYRLCDDCPVQVHSSADLSGPARTTLAEIEGEKG